VGIALVRAAERGRPDRLFEDPYATFFAAAAQGLFDAERRKAAAGGVAAAAGAAFAQDVVIRTRFFDDFLLAGAADGMRQVVLPGAGLDTRAFRLPWPEGVHVYELDLPDVLAFKERVLAETPAVARGVRHVLPVDVTGDWSPVWLDAGFDAGAPALWVVEGLLPYLRADAAAALLDAVGRLSAPGSRLACEWVPGDPAEARPARAPVLSGHEVFMPGGLPDTGAWLERHGWSTLRRDRATVAASLHRPVRTEAGGGYLTAVRF
jgi:methyltransferase (TIGR00027 family)